MSALPDTEEVTGSNPVRPTLVTRHFLFLAVLGSALWPDNWPYREGGRHAQVTGTRSSPRARTSAHMASSARVGALHAPGSAQPASSMTPTTWRTPSSQPAQ